MLNTRIPKIPNRGTHHEKRFASAPSKTDPGIEPSQSPDYRDAKERDQDREQNRLAPATTGESSMTAGITPRETR